MILDAHPAAACVHVYHRARESERRDCAGACRKAARRRSMLVLTRKAGESICIGEEIEIRIVSVRGQKVRIAIEAPQSVVVRRKELDPNIDRLKMSDAGRGERAAAARASPRAPVTSSRRRAAS